MGAEETLKMAMKGAALHHAKTCVLSESGASSGTIVYDLKDYGPDILQIYQLHNGVLLDMKTQAFATVFPENTDWLKSYTLDNNFNVILYTADMQILDIFGGYLKNNGLNSVLSVIRNGEQCKVFKGVTAVYVFMLALILNFDFGHFNPKVIEKVKSVLQQMPIAMTKIQDITNFLRKSIKTVPDIIPDMLQALLEMGMFNYPEDMWANLTTSLIYIGANLDLDTCKKEKWGNETKKRVLAQYVLKMYDRMLFNNIYLTGNDLIFLFGVDLNNNNYTGELGCLPVPAYKLSLLELVNKTTEISYQSKLCVRGLHDNEYAVELSDITNFTVKEMYKEGVVSDGSDCVIYQMIMRFGADG